MWSAHQSCFIRSSLPLPDTPVHSQVQRLFQVLLLSGDDSLRAYSHGNVIEQALRQLFFHWLDIGEGQVGPGRRTRKMRGRWFAILERKTRIKNTEATTTKIRWSSSPQQPHSTVDVESDSSWRHDSVAIAHVERGDVADGKAIARVDIRKSDGSASLHPIAFTRSFVHQGNIHV